MKKSTFFIVGKHAVTEALKNPNRKCLKIYLTEESKKNLNRENQEINILRNIQVIFRSKKELDNLSGNSETSHQGLVLEIEKKESLFILNTRNGIKKSKNIIICTGFYDIPYMLNIPGEELDKVLHYYNESHPYYKMDIAIVGAGNSAVDVALDTYRKGANSVTMIIREKEIGGNIKYWVKPDIVNRIESGEIKAFYESEILEIKENTILIKTPTGVEKINNDFVLAMTGYLPNYEILKKLGVKINDDEFKTPLYNEETMETNINGVFLAGVICGGLKTNKWFIENSRDHSQKILSTIIKR